MPFNAGAVLRVSAIGDIDTSSAIVNSFQFQLSGASGVAESLAWGDLVQIMEDVYTIILAIMNIRTVMRGAYAGSLDNATVSGYLPFSSPLDGALDTELIPRGVACLTSFPTGYSREVLRKYWGALDDTVVSAGGNMTGAGITVPADVIDYLLTPQTISGRTWTYGHSNAPGAPFRIPISGALNTIPAYQRRRRLGSGE